MKLTLAIVAITIFVIVVAKLFEKWFVNSLAEGVAKNTKGLVNTLTQVADEILSYRTATRRGEYLRLYRHWLCKKLGIKAVMLFDNIVDRKIIERKAREQRL